MNTIKLKEIDDFVKNHLKESRYLHSKNVEITCKKMAEIYLPEKVIDLQISALLHDITKYYSNEEQISILRKYKIPPCEEEIESTQILHGWTASLICDEYFPGVITKEQKQAIHAHTTGERGMSVFDMILFVADYIEDSRTHPSCVFARNFFFQTSDFSILHLYLTVQLILKQTIDYLTSMQLVIAKDTLDAYNYIGELIHGK